MIFPGVSFASPLDFPELAERTVIACSISKSHAAPGFRSGWAAGPEEFTRRLHAYVRGLVVGDPMDPTTDVGPLITADALARALSEARDYCIPDDFRELVLPALAHRLVLPSGSQGGYGDSLGNGRAEAERRGLAAGPATDWRRPRAVPRPRRGLAAPGLGHGSPLSTRRSPPEASPLLARGTTPTPGLLIAPC